MLLSGMAEKLSFLEKKSVGDNEELLLVPALRNYHHSKRQSLENKSRNNQNLFKHFRVIFVLIFFF